MTEARTRLPLLAELDILELDPGDYSGAWWVGLQAPFVYVAGVGDGLYVVDAGDPSAPTVVSRLSTGALGGISPGSVFPLGNLLVLAEARGRGYVTMDISDPANPALIAVREGATGYSHQFTAGWLLTSGTQRALTFRPNALGISADEDRAYVHRVDHDGRMTYLGEAGAFLEEGGYGSYQDGHFFSGFSSHVAKFTIDPPEQLYRVARNLSTVDYEFAQPLGNLIFAGDDHGVRSALIPHQAEPDARGADVVWMHPPEAATDVALTARVGVSMSDQVAAESLLPGSFLLRPRGGEPVSGQLSVYQNNVNFFPDQDLAEGHRLRSEGLRPQRSRRQPRGLRDFDVHHAERRGRSTPPAVSAC